MMEAAFRPPAGMGARPDWMEPFARTIDAAKKYVVSSTLDQVDWNAELVRGDPGKAVQQLFAPFRLCSSLEHFLEELLEKEFKLTPNDYA